MADKKISALTAASTPLAGTEVLPIVQSGSTVKVSVDNLTTGKTVAMNQINLENSTVGFPTLGTASGSLRLLGSGGGGFGLFGGLDGGTGRSWLQAMRTDGPVAYDLRLQPVGGNVRIGTGDVIIETAGKGIDFSANTHAAGMTSELLNWYEVGTWTGTLTATTPPTVPVTATGRYTRIGNQVTIAIEFENVSTVGAVGGLEVTGLPFTAVSSGYGPAMKSGLGTQAVTAGIYGGLSKVIFSDSGTMNNTPIVAGVGVYLRFSATYFM